jgi:hypothetical protein
MSTIKADTFDDVSGGGIQIATGSGTFQQTVYDLGTNTTGTETLSAANGNFQKGVNGGAHTLAPQSQLSSIVVQYTNDGSAGTLTTSGYTLVGGDALTTTSGHDFFLYSTVSGAFKHLHVVALQ